MHPQVASRWMGRGQGLEVRPCSPSKDGGRPGTRRTWPQTCGETVVILDVSEGERRHEHGEDAPGFVLRELPEPFLSGLALPNHASLGPCAARNASSLLGGPLLGEPALPHGVVEKDLSAADARRVELCGVRRPRHIVLDISGRERCCTGEFDTLVLCGDSFGGLLSRKREREGTGTR